MIRETMKKYLSDYDDYEKILMLLWFIGQADGNRETVRTKA